MSAFQDALAEFLRLHLAEQAALAAALESRDANVDGAHLAASRVAGNAFDRLFALPAENLSQTAGKMAALASRFAVPDCGCDPQGWAMLVAEVARFSAASALRGVA